MPGDKEIFFGKSRNAGHDELWRGGMEHGVERLMFTIIGRCMELEIARKKPLKKKRNSSFFRWKW